jgi:hypothetical protein
MNAQTTDTFCKNSFLCGNTCLIFLVYDSEKENWRILANKEIYAIVKKPTITKTIRLHRLR